MKEYASFEDLDKRYENRNVMTELEWCSNHVKSGYMTVQDAEFFRWLCRRAYNEIKMGL